MKLRETHEGCSGVRGIMTFRCMSCGNQSNNYSNGVEVCSKCCREAGICCICGKSLSDPNKTVDLSEKRIPRGSVVEIKSSGSRVTITQSVKTDNQFGYGVYLYSFAELQYTVMYRNEFTVITEAKEVDEKIGMKKMRRLSTIQKREKLNIVSAVGEAGNGGAYRNYYIQREEILDPVSLESKMETINALQFQDGARGTEGSVTGVLDQDLLEIVRDRMKGFQSGQFATQENEYALKHIEEALMWLNRRVEDRIERNVLGKNAK